MTESSGVFGLRIAAHRRTFTVASFRRRRAVPRGGYTPTFLREPVRPRQQRSLAYDLILEATRRRRGKFRELRQQAINGLARLPDVFQSGIAGQVAEQGRYDLLPGSLNNAKRNEAAPRECLDREFLHQAPLRTRRPLLTVTSTRTSERDELVRRPGPDVPVAGEALSNRSNLEFAQLLPGRLSLNTNYGPFVVAPELRSETPSLADLDVLPVQA